MSNEELTNGMAESGDSDVFKPKADADNFIDGSPVILPIRQLSNPPLALGLKTNKLSIPPIPINDLHAIEYSGLSRFEKIARCKLASFCRLAELLGWADGIYTTITLRLSADSEHFLSNPFGLLYHEITASNLIKVDMQGNVLDEGSTGLDVNRTVYLLHSAIHSARPDIKCVIQLRTTPIMAVSVMKCGLLPLCQDSLVLGDVSYHDYNPLLSQDDLIDKVERDIGPLNKVLFIRNFGLMACGETIEEAFHYARNAVTACGVQVQVAHLGADNLTVASEDAKKQTFDAETKGQGIVFEKGRRFKPGELQFSAYMRQMDNAGYRTGYLYSQSLVELQQSHRRKGSVEIPPASTGLFLEEEYQARYGSPMKTVQTYKRHEWAKQPASAFNKIADQSNLKQESAAAGGADQGQGDAPASSAENEIRSTEATKGEARSKPADMVKQESQKSDTLRSTDSGTDEEAAPGSEKKNKFRMPSFSKGKKKKQQTAV